MECEKSFWESIIYVVVGGLIALFPSIIGYYIEKKKHRNQKIYDTQWEALTTLYEKIQTTDISIETYMNPLNRETDYQVELAKRVERDFNDMSHYYLKHKVLFPESVIRKMEEFIVTVRNNLTTFDLVSLYTDERRAKKANAAWEKQRSGNIRLLKEEIEGIIYRNLGIKKKGVKK